MGVGGNFWDFLKPCARLEGFDFLRNKRVAVDLSYWIVQQETAIKGDHRSSHIRQTFFRTVNLFVKFGAYPVFVLDGTPSPLKNQTRILRFFRSSGIDLSRLQEAKEGVSVERNRAFTKCVEECVVMLELLGMPVLKAKAEAEALCAELNREGHVDACITADSDAFLYGARCVIKRIQPKSKEPFECYHISDIETVLELRRNHLIAVSLLVGNDHDLKGIMGIGLETAVRFVKSFREDEIFDWLHKLAKGDPLLVQESVGGGKEAICFSDDKSTRKSPHCSYCGHPGKKKAHLKFSCGYCNSNTGQSCLQKPVGFKCCCLSCDKDRIEKLNRKNETWRNSVCQKIASVPNFPNDEILQMYLRKNHGTDDGPYIEWAPPCPDMLVDFLAYQQQWKPSYIRQRLLPMLSTIYLRDMASSPRDDLLCGQYEFNSIQRVKTTYGHNVFIVSWKKATTVLSDAVYLSTEESDLQQEPTKHDGYPDFPEELDAPYVYRERGCCFLLTEEDMELVRRAFPAKTSHFLKEWELKEMKLGKCKSNFGSERTPVMSRSSGGQSVQPRITEFYHSTKMVPPNKSVDNVDNSGDSSQGKRKSSSSRVPKSVRRRLLFGMYEKDTLSVGECSPSMANKGVCILFVKDDPPCDAIVDVMLQHRAQEVLAFGDVSCVLYAIGMAKDRIESVITNAHNLEPHGVEIVQLIENGFSLPTMLMQPNGKRMVSNNRLHLFSSTSIASVLYGLSRNEVNILWRRGLNSVKEKTASTYAVDKNKTDAIVAGRVKVKQKGIIRKHEPSRKKRLEWTAELHALFEKAYNELGPEKAVPKRIAEHMGVPDLTRDKVASHLQKYRNSMKPLEANQGSVSSSSETEESKGLGVLQSHLYGSCTPPGPRLCSPDAKVSIWASSSQRLNPHKGFSFGSSHRRICTNFGGLQLHEQVMIMPPRTSKHTCYDNDCRPQGSSFAGYILKNDGTSIELGKLEASSEGNIFRETLVSAPVTYSNQPIVQNNQILSISHQHSVMGREQVMYGNGNQTLQPLTTGDSSWSQEQPAFPSPNCRVETKISNQPLEASFGENAEKGFSLHDQDACIHFMETLLNDNPIQSPADNGLTTKNSLLLPSSSMFPCGQDFPVLLMEKLGDDFQVPDSMPLFDGIPQLHSPESLPERIQYLDGFQDEAGSSVDPQIEWLDLDFDDGI